MGEKYKEQKNRTMIHTEKRQHKKRKQIKIK